MVPVVSIVGCKNSGKTRLIEGVVPELKRRGYRIGTIKHDSHGLKPEGVDREGTDTYRHQLCGAESVVLSGPNKLMLIKQVNRPRTIDEINRAYLCGLDLVLAEGYKNEDKPKIEVYRQEVGGGNGLLCKPEDNLIALVSDSRFALDLPWFGLNDYSRVADFLEEKFLCREQVPEIDLIVNQQKILLKRFVRGFLKKAILGMIGSLRDVPENPQSVEIKIR